MPTPTGDQMTAMRSPQEIREAAASSTTHEPPATDSEMIVREMWKMHYQAMRHIFAFGLLLSVILAVQLVALFFLLRK